MIIALTLLVVILAVYVVFLEKRIKLLEADFKTFFDVSNSLLRLIDTLHDQVVVIAKEIGLYEEDSNDNSNSQRN